MCGQQLRAVVVAALVVGCSGTTDGRTTGREETSDSGGATSSGGSASSGAAESGGSSFGGADFSCFGEQVAAPEGMYTYRAALSRAESVGEPVLDAEVLACNELTSCSAPVATTGTNDDGELSIELPASFSGYLRVDTSSIIDFVEPVGLGQEVEEIELFTLRDVEQLGQLAGIATNGDIGHAIVRIVDCSGNGVPGAQVRTSQATEETQSVALDWSSYRIRILAQQTDASGMVAIFNIPTGVVRLEVLTDSHSAEHELVVLAGTATHATIPLH